MILRVRVLDYWYPTDRDGLYIYSKSNVGDLDLNFMSKIFDFPTFVLLALTLLGVSIILWITLKSDSSFGYIFLYIFGAILGKPAGKLIEDNPLYIIFNSMCLVITILFSSLITSRCYLINKFDKQSF